MIPASVGEQCATRSCSDIPASLQNMRVEDASQRGHGAGMRPRYDGPLALEVVHGAPHHLMRHRIGKQDQKIGASDLIFHGTGHLREDLRLTVILFTKRFIAADHTVVPADDNDAH